MFLKEQIIYSINVIRRWGILVETWMRDSITSLKTAIELYNNGNEGKYRQAIILAEQTIESMMRRCLAIKHGETPPFKYNPLLKRFIEKEGIDAELEESIRTLRNIRDGFYHDDISNFVRLLKGTTSGLTLEKSHVKDNLTTACKLTKLITDEDVSLNP